MPEAYHALMRTTRPLYDDVLDRARLIAAKLRAEQRRYITQPRAMGLRQGYDLDNIQELIAQIEGENTC